MATEYRLRDVNNNLQRKITLNSDNRLTVQDSSGNELGSLEKLITPKFGTEQTVSIDAGATSTIDKGIYYARCGANTSVEYSPDGGTTWYTLISAGGVGLVISDGSNVRFNNGGTAAEDSYLLPIE